MNLIPRRGAKRPGPVGRVKAAFSNLQGLAVVALAVAVLALFVAVTR